MRRFRLTAQDPCPNIIGMSDDTTYFRPSALTEALDILKSAAPRVAAGCTDLFPATERKILPGPVLDITAIADLRGITRDQTGLRIGATTTWTDVIKADLPAALDGLKLAAREVGASQIQNRGTIAGNLCNASPAADGVPPLLVLDAQVELQSTDRKRFLTLAEFLTGPRQTARQSDELLTAIQIPSSALQGVAHFQKLGARKYLVISIAMTAARLVIDRDVVTEAALAIGACGPVATRLPKAEAALVGHRLDPSRITDAMVADAIAPIDDMRADATYRTRAAGELVRRTVASLAQTQAAA